MIVPQDLLRRVLPPRDDAAHGVVRRLASPGGSGALRASAPAAVRAPPSRGRRVRVRRRGAGRGAEGEKVREPKLLLAPLVQPLAPRFRAALALRHDLGLDEDHDDVTDFDRAPRRRRDAPSVLDASEQSLELSADLRRVEASDVPARPADGFRRGGRRLRVHRAVFLALFSRRPLLLVAPLPLRLASVLLEPLLLRASLLLLPAHAGGPLLPLARGLGVRSRVRCGRFIGTIVVRIFAADRVAAPPHGATPPRAGPVVHALFRREVGSGLRKRRCL